MSNIFDKVLRYFWVLASAFITVFVFGFAAAALWYGLSLGWRAFQNVISCCF